MSILLVLNNFMKNLDDTI